jgi:transcriptional regulator with XRE-family HTH domain
MEIINQWLGANIKRRRREYGWSQEKLAEMAYVARETLIAYEQGEVWPSADVVLSLSKAFGCAPFELYVDPGKPVEFGPTPKQALDALARALEFRKYEYRAESVSPVKRELFDALASINDAEADLILTSFKASRKPLVSEVHDRKKLDKAK